MTITMLTAEQFDARNAKYHELSEVRQKAKWANSAARDAMQGKPKDGELMVKFEETSSAYNAAVKALNDFHAEGVGMVYVEERRTGSAIEIHPFGNYFHSITVYRPEPPDTPRQEVRPARVNWGGIGSVTADEAEAYAFAIKLASEKARELNAQFIHEMHSAAKD